jgi:hypothetical protein
MNMRNWVRDCIASPAKKPLPILSFPSAQLLDVSVRELVCSSDLQARGMKAVADRGDSAAAVSMMDLSVEAEAFGSNIVFSDDEVPTVVGAIITDEDEADEIMSDREAETLVSLVVAPSSGKNGSYCFKMLVNAETHELFYFRRHKITKKDAVGFLAEDIRKIMSHR